MATYTQEELHALHARAHAAVVGSTPTGDAAVRLRKPAARQHVPVVKPVRVRRPQGYHVP